jgi:hypothetical protein
MTSGEVWGAQARGSEIPKVKAFVGPLPPRRRGIEFTTDVWPDAACPPGQAFWSGPRDGVVVSGRHARIKVVVTKNAQTEE